MAAFILCEICNNHREGQQLCLNAGLHKKLSSLLCQREVLTSAVLKKWIVLCLGKLCEDFVLAKYMCVSEVGYSCFQPLLCDVNPDVRMAAVSTTGELFGASQGNLIQSQPSTTTAFNSFGMPPPAGVPSWNSTQASIGINRQASVDRSMPASTTNRSNGFGLNPFDSSRGSNSNGTAHEQLELRQSELQLAMLNLDRLSDGNATVRREAVVALSKV